MVGAAFADGVGPETVWSGLRLFGSDLFARRSAAVRARHLPVHTVTETNAFDAARRRAGSEATRKLLVFQAAAWMSLLATAVAESGPYDASDGILSPDLELARPPGLLDLLRGAEQDHQLKYAAAALEEARRSPTADGERILTATVDDLPRAGATPSVRYTRIRAALDRARAEPR